MNLPPFILEIRDNLSNLPNYTHTINRLDREYAEKLSAEDNLLPVAKEVKDADYVNNTCGSDEKAVSRIVSASIGRPAPYDRCNAEAKLSDDDKFYCADDKEDISRPGKTPFRNARARMLDPDSKTSSYCSMHHDGEDDEKDLDEKEEKSYSNSDIEESDFDYAHHWNQQEIEKDARLAKAIRRNDVRELHRLTVRSHFDSDYAQHVAETDHENDALCYQDFVCRKWEKVEMMVNDVEDGVCISILLPELVDVSVNTKGAYSLLLDATRRKFSEEDSAICCYKAEYSFEGAASAISQRTVEQDYQSESGILFIFIDRLRLAKESTQENSSPEEKTIDSGVSSNKEFISDKQVVNNQGDGSMMVKISRGISKMFSFKKSKDCSTFSNKI